jgi:hypothetical protein
VLIGSPKNMGTGLNVQDRLIDLHYLSPPWYPSDVTQPHGRIERQGNLNSEIGIKLVCDRRHLRFDRLGYGRAQGSASSTRRLSGDDSVRTLEDISEISMFEMAEALAAGDDRVIRVAELGGDIERLQRLKTAHYDNQRTCAAPLRTCRAQYGIKRTEADVADARRGQQGARRRLSPVRGHGRRQDVRQAGRSRRGDVGPRPQGFRRIAPNETEIGKSTISRSSSAHAVAAPAMRSSSRSGLMKGRSTRSARLRTSTRSTRPALPGASTVPCSASRPSLPRRSEELEGAARARSRARRKYGGPFPQEGELSEKTAERAQIQAALAAEGKEKPAVSHSALAGLQPESIDEDDGDVAHAMVARFSGEPLNPNDEFDDGPFVRYWLTRDDDIVVQTLHAGADARGRDILRWLDQAYGKPIVVVEATQEAMGFWDKMQKEGLVYSVDGADGNPSPLEAQSVPMPEPRASANVVDAAEFTRGMTPEQVEEGRVEMERQLQILLPGDKVALVVGRRIFDGEREVAGVYYHRSRLIKVALAVENEPTWTLGHEAVHAMRSLGLFTPQEWDRLVDAAWYPKTEENVRKRWGHLNLSEDSLREEAVAEYVGEWWALRQEMGKLKGIESLAARALMRMLKFVAALARAVGRIIGKPNPVGEAMSIMDRLVRGEIGSRPVGFGEPPRFPYADDPAYSVVSGVAPAGHEFEGATESRWQEAKKGVGSGPGMVANAKEWWSDLVGGFTRHHRHLPNIPRFADVGQQLRNLEAAPDAAMDSSIRYLKQLVGKMDKAEYDLFSRKVVLDDLAWDAGEGRELPFGFTPTKLTEARARVDAQFNLNRKLVDALRLRKEHNRRITDAMVAAGVLDKEQVRNPAYFRHMVLDYARHEAALARGPNKVKSPYWARRMGSVLDINANLLEAELDWLQKAQIDTATAKTIEWIKKSNLNIREELRTKARDNNRQKLMERLAVDPAARKEDGHFRSLIARGFALVKDELESGTLVVPAHLQRMADDIVNDRRDGDPPFALMAWILDGSKPGSMGAGMVLKYAGQRKQWIRKLLGDAYIDPEDIEGLVKHYRPEGMTTWQPRAGRHLFTAKTITEHAVDMFVDKLADTASPGLDRAELAAALGTVRNQLVQGPERYTMVLPSELAATLDDLGDRRGEGMVARFFGGIQSAWKRWVLINPRRFFKYNLNNMTGDLDAIIAGNPHSLTRVKEAWKMLREASKGAPSQRYTEALERGVFTSGLSAQEIPDINAFSDFKHLAEGRTKARLLATPFTKIWRALQDTTNFREALFRLAAYLDYADRIDAGEPMSKVGYGGSVPKMVDAVSDPRDKAALLARDLVGDYGSISVAGGWLRKYLVPFWSWMEINAKRYWRLNSNAWSQGVGQGFRASGATAAGALAKGASLTAYLYLRMALVYAMLYAWNHLLYPDEEDELGEMQRQQLHIILGRDQDGQIITLRTQGALSDALNTFGFLDAARAFKAYQDGQGSLGQIAKDWLKAPINRVGTAITPLISAPVEQALGVELWPDLFEPRVIHDPWRHLFETVNLENEYDVAADKPTRGYVRSWTESVVYRRDPQEMAYDEAKGIAYDWLDRVKGQGGGGGFTSERSEALRDYRMALRYSDQSAADKALVRYAQLGGTEKGLEASKAKQHPLGPIAKKDRAEFLDSLTPDQLETFAEAEEYWKRLYEDGGAEAPPKD